MAVFCRIASQYEFDNSASIIIFETVRIWGKILLTPHMPISVDDEEYRRRILTQLNRGEG